MKDAALASQVLTEVLNTMISFHYSSNGPVSVHSEGDCWVVECGFDFLTALFIWKQEGGHYGGRNRATWADDALSAWAEWAKQATPSDLLEVEMKAAKIFNDFREDVTNVKAAGYRWSDDIGGWTNRDSREEY
ncbi:hypothetical protein JZU46_01270 [bacterium]|nr:hypothetical protein [bacterium]